MSDRLQKSGSRGGDNWGAVPAGATVSAPHGNPNGSYVGRGRLAAAAAVGGAVAAAIPDIRGTYPALAEYLTLRVLDGKPRELSSLTFFAEDGRLKACLADKDLGCNLFRSGEGLADVLKALESALCDGTADWRERKPGPSPRRG